MKSYVFSRVGMENALEHVKPGDTIIWGTLKFTAGQRIDDKKRVYYWGNQKRCFGYSNRTSAISRLKKSPKKLWEINP